MNTMKSNILNSDVFRWSTVSIQSASDNLMLAEEDLQNAHSHLSKQVGGWQQASLLPTSQSTAYHLRLIVNKTLFQMSN